MVSLFKSVRFPFKGLSYIINHRSLLKFLIIPITIDVIISIILLIFIFSQIPDSVNMLVDWLTNYVSNSDGFFNWFISLLIKGGGFYMDGERIKDDSAEINIKEGTVFKVGKRRFFKIIS